MGQLASRASAVNEEWLRLDEARVMEADFLAEKFMDLVRSGEVDEEVVARLGGPVTDGVEPSTLEELLQRVVGIRDLESSERAALAAAAQTRVSALLHAGESETAAYDRLLAMRAAVLAKLQQSLVAARVAAARAAARGVASSAGAAAAAAGGKMSPAEVGIKTGVALFLSFVRALSRRDSELCSDVLVEFLPVLKGLPALSLRGDGQLSPAMAESMDNLARWLLPLMGSDGDALADHVRPELLQGVLSLGLASGSVRLLLATVRALLADGGRDVALGSVVSALAALNAEPIEPNISPLRTLAISAPTSKAELLCTRAPHSAVACDGTFLYVHNNAGLVKIGTGAGGTTLGAIAASNAGWRSGEKGSLACAAGRLFYRSSDLAPAGFIELDCDSLQPLEAVGGGEEEEEEDAAAGGDAMPAAADGIASPLISNGSSLVLLHDGLALQYDVLPDCRTAPRLRRRVALQPRGEAEAVDVAAPLLWYTNGFRLVALLPASGDGGLRCREWALRTGAEVEEVDVGQLGGLSEADDPKAADWVLRGLSAAFDGAHNRMWLYAPNHGRLNVTAWRNGGAAIPAAEPAAWDAPTALAVDGIAIDLDAPPASLPAAHLAHWLLAQLARLSEGVGDDAEEEDVRTEEPFVVDLHAATFTSLAAIMDSLAADLPACQPKTLHAALAVVRLLATNLGRAASSGTSTDSIGAADALASLLAHLNAITALQAPDGASEDAAAGLVTLQKVVWRLLASGLDAFTTGSGAQGDFLLSLLRTASASPTASKFLPVFIDSLAQRRGLAGLLSAAAAASAGDADADAGSEESKAAADGAAATPASNELLDYLLDYLSTAASEDVAAVLAGGDDVAREPSPVSRLFKSLQRDLLSQAAAAAADALEDAAQAQAAAALAAGDMEGSELPRVRAALLAGPPIVTEALSTAAARLVTYVTQVVTRAASLLADSVLPSGSAPLNALRSSLLGSLLPTLFVTLRALLPRLPADATAALLQPMGSLLPLLDGLQALASGAEEEKAADGDDAAAAAEEAAAAGGPKSEATVGTRVFESSHPYDNGMDVKEDISFPGADRLRLEFDGNCKTEEGYDYLAIFAGGAPDDASPLFKYSGSVSSWPKEAVIVEGSHIRMHFHTDGSGNDWGYKLTITAVKTVALTAGKPLPWQADLLQAAASLTAALLAVTVGGSPLAEDEKEHERWLRSEVFRNSLDELDLTSADGEPSREAGSVTSADKEAFLRDLVDSTPDSLAEGLASQMESITARGASGMHLKIGGAPLRRAERAVAAALLKHSGLVTEAVSFARLRGRRASRSPHALLAVFRTAATLRGWLIQRRQRTRKAYDVLADDVVSKARFLLRLRPFFEEAAAEPVVAADDGAAAAAGSPSRWGMLKKRVDTASATGLLARSLSQWSRLKRSRGGGEEDTPEARAQKAIVAFAKSSVSLDSLAGVLARRAARASARASGLALLATLAAHDWALPAVGARLLLALNPADLGASWHPLQHLEAVKPELVASVRTAFHAVVSQLAASLLPADEAAVAQLTEAQAMPVRALLAMLTVAWREEDEPLLARLQLFDAAARLAAASDARLADAAAALSLFLGERVLSWGGASGSQYLAALFCQLTAAAASGAPAAPAREAPTFSALVQLYNFTTQRPLALDGDQLATLLRLLANGSPRAARLLTRLLARLLPAVQPAALLAALPVAFGEAAAAGAAGDAPLWSSDCLGLDFLLVLAGSAASGFALPALSAVCGANPLLSAAIASSSSGTSVADALGGAALHGSSAGTALRAFAADIRFLLRALWAAKHWSGAVSHALSSALQPLALLRTALRLNPLARVSAQMGTQLAAAVAALDVLGGTPAELLPGARVCEPDGGVGTIVSRPLHAPVAEVLIDGERMPRRFVAKALRIASNDAAAAVLPADGSEDAIAAVVSSDNLRAMLSLLSLRAPADIDDAASDEASEAVLAKLAAAVLRTLRILLAAAPATVRAALEDGDALRRLLVLALQPAAPAGRSATLSSAEAASVTGWTRQLEAALQASADVTESASLSDDASATRPLPGNPSPDGEGKLLAAVGGDAMDVGLLTVAPSLPASAWQASVQLSLTAQAEAVVDDGSSPHAAVGLLLQGDAPPTAPEWAWFDDADPHIVALSCLMPAIDGNDARAPRSAAVIALHFAQPGGATPTLVVRGPHPNTGVHWEAPFPALTADKLADFTLKLDYSRGSLRAWLGDDEAAAVTLPVSLERALFGSRASFTVYASAVSTMTEARLRACELTGHAALGAAAAGGDDAAAGDLRLVGDDEEDIAAALAAVMGGAVEESDIVLGDAEEALPLAAVWCSGMGKADQEALNAMTDGVAEDAFTATLDKPGQPVVAVLQHQSTGGAAVTGWSVTIACDSFSNPMATGLLFLSHAFPDVAALAERYSGVLDVDAALAEAVAQASEGKDADMLPVAALRATAAGEVLRGRLDEPRRTRFVTVIALTTLGSGSDSIDLGSVEVMGQPLVRKLPPGAAMKAAAEAAASMDVLRDIRVIRAPGVAYEGMRPLGPALGADGRGTVCGAWAPADADMAAVGEWEGTFEWPEEEEEDAKLKKMLLRMQPGGWGIMQLQGRASAPAGGSAPPLLWDAERKGPDIELFEDGMGVTRTNSSGWGCQRTAVALETDTMVRWEIISNDGSYLYIGLCTPGWSGDSSSLNNGEAIAYQADGYLYRKGSHVGNTDRIGTGDIIDMHVQVSIGKLDFIKDGRVFASIEDIGDGPWHVAVCFGGSSQRVKLVGGGGAGLDKFVAAQAVAVDGSFAGDAGGSLRATSTLWKASSLELPEGMTFNLASSQDGPGSLVGTWTAGDKTGAVSLQPSKLAPVVALSVRSARTLKLTAEDIIVPLRAPEGHRDDEGGDAPSAPSLSWERAPAGPDIKVSDGGSLITRTNSSGWGCQVCGGRITSGVTTVEIDVEAHDNSSYLLIGVADVDKLESGDVSLSSKLSGSHVWSLQADGDSYASGSCSGTGKRLTTGSHVTLVIDMEAHTMELKVDGELAKKFTDLPAAVSPAVCFGGSNQLVRLSSPPDNGFILFRRGTVAAPLAEATLLPLAPAPPLFGMLPADGDSNLAGFATAALQQASLVSLPAVVPPAAASRRGRLWDVDASEPLLLRNTRGALRERGAVSTDRPVPPLSDAASIYYFEAEVVSLAEGTATVSIGFADEAFPVDDTLVGWTPTSWGFHSDDAARVTGGKNYEAWDAPRWGAGDVVGAGIDLATRAIFFTVNGTLAGFAWDGAKVPPALDLFPTVAVNNTAELRLNYGASAFRFTNFDALTAMTKALAAARSAPGSSSGGASGSDGDDDIVLFPRDGDAAAGAVAVLDGALLPADDTTRPGKQAAALKEAPFLYLPAADELEADAAAELAALPAALRRLAGRGLVAAIVESKPDSKQYRVRTLDGASGAVLDGLLPESLLRVVPQDSGLLATDALLPLPAAGSPAAAVAVSSLLAAERGASVLQARATVAALLAGGGAGDDAWLPSVGGVPGFISLLRAWHAGLLNEPTRSDEVRAAVAPLVTAALAGGSAAELASALQAEVKDCLAATLVAKTRTRKFESEHPYPNNANILDVIRFPGAQSLRITFAPECVTERNYDRLGFFTDAERNSLVEDRHGPSGDAWAPLTIPGDTVYTKFVSDGSNNAWGYAFTVTAKGAGGGIADAAALTQPVPARGFWLAHFLLDLDEPDAATLSGVIVALAAFLREVGKPMEQRKEAMALLMRALHASGQVGGAVGESMEEMALHLRATVKASTHDVWRKPFVQSCVALMAAWEDVKEAAAAGVSEGGKEEESEATQEAEEEEKKVELPPDPLAELTWTTEKSGPDISLSNGNATVTRTNSSGYGSQLGNVWISADTAGSSPATIELSIDNNDSVYLYVGVVSREYTDWSNSMSGSNCWSYEADGCNYSNGSSQSSVARYGSGDVIKMVVDVSSSSAEERTITFFKNGEQVIRMTGVASEVCLAACFGGSSQLVSIRSAFGSVGGAGGASGVSGFSRWVSNVRSAKSLLQQLSVEDGSRSCEFDALQSEVADSLKGVPVAIVNGKAVIGDDLALTGVASSGFATVGVPAAARTSGKWYYEVIVLTSGCMQLGWADSRYRGQPARGAGVGDDAFSWAYDGWRRKKWNETDGGDWGASWSEGDVVGVAVDLDAREMRFSLNGNWGGDMGLAFSNVRAVGAVYPAISFNSSERPQFLIGGSWPLRHAAPSDDYRSVWDGLQESGGASAETIMAAFADGEATRWTPAMDAALARVAVHTAAAKRSKPSELDVLTMSFDASSLPASLASLPAAEVKARFALLRVVNSRVRDVLPLVNWTDTSPHSLAGLLRARKSLLFLETTKSLTDVVIKHTMSARSRDDNEGDRISITVNRPRAVRVGERAEAGETLGEADWADTLLGQFQRRMKALPTRRLRRPYRCWKVDFEGEGSIDAGGPYFESLSQQCAELHTAALPLFSRTPDARAHSGVNQDKFILNSGATSELALGLLEWVGKLIGMALRSGNRIDLNLAPMVWKLLAQEELTMRDIEAVDSMLVRSLEILSNCEEHGVGADDFADLFDETFTTNSSDGREVELIPGGRDVRVTYDNRLEFVAAVQAYRLHEFDRQAAAIRRGLAQIVPAFVLPLLTGSQLEILVCGLPEIDVEMLRSTTTYSGPSPSDAHVGFLWEVLEHDFTTQERIQFLRFVSGRSRLPASPEEARRPYCHLELRGMSVGSPDTYLPAAHTCFFQLDLPAYTSREVLCEKLRYAVATCQAIDTDNDASGSRGAWA